uniref:Putative secreted protein n=1 Tax=Amblyomma cajennense TaxID=34607 RepID=A0A023FBS4_AMBCJ
MHLFRKSAFQTLVTEIAVLLLQVFLVFFLDGEPESRAELWPEEHATSMVTLVRHFSSGNYPIRDMKDSRGVWWDSAVHVNVYQMKMSDCGPHVALSENTSSEQSGCIL